MDSPDYRRVEKAIRFLSDHATDQPTLADVAAHIGLSSYHFQRLFQRWAGVSPKRFLQYLTAEHAKKLLRESASVLEATYHVGLSSPGRLHDLFVSAEAVTPGEWKAGGKGIEIRYGFLGTPFGECLAAVTDRGLCSLGFVEPGDRVDALAELHAEWERAELREDPVPIRPLVERAFGEVATAGPSLRLLLRGTNFQIQVWRALLRIPEGTVVSYGGVACFLGHPMAPRAVASAVARNPVAYLIPCHRVLRKTGAIGGYRWDPVRKRAMLAREAASQQTRLT